MVGKQHDRWSVPLIGSAELKVGLAWIGWVPSSRQLQVASFAAESTTDNLLTSYLCCCHPIYEFAPCTPVFPRKNTCALPKSFPFAHTCSFVALPRPLTAQCSNQLRRLCVFTVSTNSIVANDVFLALQKIYPQFLYGFPHSPISQNYYCITVDHFGYLEIFCFKRYIKLPLVSYSTSQTQPFIKYTET